MSPVNSLLSETLPDDPIPILADWLREARQKGIQPNPDAMVLATASESGHPSARVVLCKQIEVDAGYLVFFTNYASRKGRELAMLPKAASVFHWDALSRQARVEGRVVRSPAEESDRYFASRALESRIGAWASRQSEPLASRQVLEERMLAAAAEHGVPGASSEIAIPRPPHWGGFRLWIESIELWVEGPNRVHDRAIWRRSLERRDDYSFNAASWQATRLYP